MSTDLFGIVPLLAEPLKHPRAGRNAYPAPPGTGPEGKRCRDCANYVRVCGGANYFSKCELNKGRWTNGRATDINSRMPACRLFEASA